MAADIVNLRQARKAKQRGEKERQAAANRARFGRTKAARCGEEADQQRRETELAGKRLDKPEES
jgi:hypothetical protein